MSSDERVLTKTIENCGSMALWSIDINNKRRSRGLHATSLRGFRVRVVVVGQQKNVRTSLCDIDVSNRYTVLCTKGTSVQIDCYIVLQHSLSLPR